MNYFQKILELLLLDGITPEINTIFHIRGEFEFLYISSEEKGIEFLKEEYISRITDFLFSKEYSDVNIDDYIVEYENIRKIASIKYQENADGSKFRYEPNSNYTELLEKLKIAAISGWLEENHQLRSKIYDFYKYAKLEDIKNLRIKYIQFKENR